MKTEAKGITFLEFCECLHGNITNAINKTCRNCKYRFILPSKEPCIKCEYYSKWEKEHSNH